MYVYPGRRPVLLPLVSDVVLDVYNDEVKKCRVREEVNKDSPKERGNGEDFI